MRKSHADAARAILGEDIVFPDEIAEVRGLSYSEEQLRRLADMLPSEEVLRWCKAAGYAVVAGPSKPLSLLEVRGLKPELFYVKSEGWYADYDFAKNDKAGLGWLAIRKEPVPRSTGKNWEEQQRLLGSEEYVPNAGELSWFITAFFEVRGVRLFGRVYARTSSVTSDGLRVAVGGFGGRGLGVYDDWVGRRDDYVGLAASRKFPQVET